MPDIGSISPDILLPPHPLHFLTIIRYVSLLFILFMVISPREGGGTVFLIMLGAAALLIVADVYGADVIQRRFTVFLIRVFAVVIPMIRPCTSTSGPPELPGLIEASVCRNSWNGFSSTPRRPTALTIP